MKLSMTKNCINICEKEDFLEKYSRFGFSLDTTDTSYGVYNIIEPDEYSCSSLESLLEELAEIGETETVVTWRGDSEFDVEICNDYRD